MAKNRSRKSRRRNQSDLPQGLSRVALYELPEKNGDYVRLSEYDAHRDTPWYSVNGTSGSAYSGGLVTKSNYELLQEMLNHTHPDDSEPVVWALYHGPYQSYGIVVRYDLLDPEIRRVIDALDDYPLISEDKYGELQLEAEQEAWDRWGDQEFTNKIRDHYDLEDFPDDVDAYDLFEKAKEHTSTYWEDTAEGIHIDMDRVVKGAIEIIDNDPDLREGLGLGSLDTNPRGSKKRGRKSSKKGARCGKGQLKIRRKGYRRADGTRVAATTFCAADRGEKGRGPDLIPTPRPGTLGGEGYTSKSAEARHRILRKHFREYGYASTVATLQSRINLGHRTMGKKALRVFEADKKWVQRTLGKERNPSDGPLDDRQARVAKHISNPF